METDHRGIPFKIDKVKRLFFRILRISAAFPVPRESGFF
jgi:hypothetical protein